MGHRLIAILIACLLAAPLLAGLTIAGDASADTMTAWMSGTIHEEISAGEFVLQEMDDEGYLHVVYYDENEGAIGYATNAGGAWTHEVVPNTENAGDRASLALDSEGNAHISFFDSEGRLKYANNIGSWIVTTVINADVEWSAIVMDGEDQAHIVYVDEDEDAVMYVNKLTSGWSVPTEIDTSLDGFSGLAASIGDDGIIHIAYKDDFGDELVYASGHGGNWSDEVVVDGLDIYQYIDIALMGPEVVIAFVDDDDHVRVAQGTEGEWDLETVDNATVARMSISLALDSSGARHVTYYDWLEGDLLYATDVSGEWSAMTLDGDDDKGWANAISIDALDRVHITYLDMTDDQLLYITDEGGRWASSIVDAEGDVGSYSSIFVDEDFTVHIAYYDASLHALKYANDADGWDIEVVDNATHVGKAPALAVDSFGDAHIVYWDESQGILKYASDVGGEWRSIILEGTTEVGMVSSIAVDSDDHVHVAYLDNDLGYLVYANNSDGWDDLRLDTSGNVEEGNAMAIGPSDVVHIAYIKNGTLIHAYQSGNQWVFENVMDDVSSGISMKITSEGDVRIACFDDTLGDLIVLSNQGGAWEAASIDETGNAGFDTALVMDEEDLERLVYTHQVGGVQLGYAMKDSGIWLMSAFDDLNVGEQVSLAIDGFGRMHITYYDATEGDLGYIVSLTRPTAPLGLEASGVENAVELAWEAPATDGGSEVLSYRIYSGDSADSLTLLDEVSGEARNYTDGNITIASTRYYAIEAVSAEGTGVRTEVISAMAVARPTAPRDVDVNAGDGKVKLTWSAPASDGGVDVILYNVYRSDTPSDPVLIGNTTSMSYTDNDLTNGEKYYYWISAVNDVGEGDSSAVVDATPSASDGVDDTLIIAIAIVAVIAVVLIALYLLRSAGKL